MIECLKMYKINNKVINFITKDMDNLKEVLADGGQILQR